VATRQIINESIFNIENLRDCEKYVLATQRRLDKAVANNDVKSMQSLTYFLSRSIAVKTLAVWRITYHNKGKYTAGIDRVSVPKKSKEAQMRMRTKLLQEIDLTRKPDVIRRVYIPKSNGKKRPLGIPTIRDRVNQEILRTMLEPITEYHAHWEYPQ
jgi:RNA-directed DNA polymerase